MNLLDTIAQRFGYARKAAVIDTAPYILQRTAPASAWSIPPSTMYEAQAELYQRLSWVQIAVSTVARVAATTDIGVYSMAGEKKIAEENHPFENLLRRPNPLQSRYEFLESVFSYRAINGNAYVWMNRARPNAAPSEIWVLPPKQIRPVPDGKMFLRGYMYDPGDGTPPIPLEPWEIAHFKLFHPNDWFVGLSPVEALALVATGDLAQQRWNTNIFDKENAKLPGALAFAQPIDDAMWAKMKADIRAEHGGTERKMMMIRNAGERGVQWIPMGMTQSDVDFLNSRTFTKEEVFALYAPGLASVLAVNATEANSMAGRNTFAEYAVWPSLVAVAEKMTVDILDSFGPNLVVEFDDVRDTDRAMELAEQDAFARVHTIDEVRQRFYEADPIGDERGRLTVAELSRAWAPMPRAEDQTDQIEEIPQAQPTNEIAKRREMRALRNWLKKRAVPDLAEFKNVLLTDAEVFAIAQEVGAVVDAPFLDAGWGDYP